SAPRRAEPIAARTAGYQRCAGSWAIDAAAAGAALTLAVGGKVGRNFGGRRARVACSMANASEISLGSSQRPAKIETPTGSSPAKPIGTEMLGYPETAAGLDEPNTKASPWPSVVTQAGLLVGAAIASRCRLASVSLMLRCAASVAANRWAL